MNSGYKNVPVLVVDDLPDGSRSRVEFVAVPRAPRFDPTVFLSLAPLLSLASAGLSGPLSAERQKSPAALDREARIAATERKFGYDRGGSYRLREKHPELV